jgi:hypothetical protein
MNTLQDAWNEFHASMTSGTPATDANKSMKNTLHSLTKLAFYRGALSLIVIMNDVAESEATEEACNQVFNNLAEECTLVFNEAQERAAEIMAKRKIL